MMRRILSIINLLSVPSCLPVVFAAVLLGIACEGLGWWRVLPAILPGDEVFNIQRAAGLTARALVGWPQPPDAPPMSDLTTDGIGIVIAGITLLLVGLFLKATRSFTDTWLVRAARDVRLVVLDDPAGAAIANEPTKLTTVLLGDRSLLASKSPILSARLDADFLANTLPHVAANTRELLALGVDADANVGLARRLLSLRRELPPLQLLDRLAVRIDPRELRSSIGRDGFAEFADAASDAWLTSLPEARCRRLLRDQPPSKVRLANRPGRAAIVIIGLGETGLELLLRLCAQAQSPSYEPLILVLVDTEAPAVAQEFLDLWPALTLAAEFIPLALEAHLPQSATSLFRHLHKEELVPTCVYIALEDTPLAAAWEREVNLAIRLIGQDSPLLLMVGAQTDGDANLLAGEETLELLQRQLHSDYLDRPRNIAQPDTPSIADWCRLPFDLQEDNRSLADHLWAKARDLDLRIDPGSGEGRLHLTDAQVERLAAAEHRRWLASRAVAGWRFEATRADAERVHPSMVPWPQLSESERDKDRNVVRQMPRVLRAAGLCVRPLEGVSLPRSRAIEEEAAALVAELRRCAAPGAIPHLIVALEDASSFRLARRLTEFPEMAVSLVIAQPMAGLAIAAGMSAQAASQVASAAQTIWVTQPTALGTVLGRWPMLGGDVA
jgi:RyR domain